MPPYKAWTISPLAPYGDYKSDEYMAEIAAANADTNRRKMEAEAERLETAQMLAAQKHRDALNLAEREWARKMPLDDLMGKWSDEETLRGLEIDTKTLNRDWAKNRPRREEEEQKKVAKEKEEREEKKRQGERRNRNKKLDQQYKAAEYRVDELDPDYLSKVIDSAIGSGNFPEEMMYSPDTDDVYHSDLAYHLGQNNPLAGQRVSAPSAETIMEFIPRNVDEETGLEDFEGFRNYLAPRLQYGDTRDEVKAEQERKRKELASEKEKKERQRGIEDRRKESEKAQKNQRDAKVRQDVAEEIVRPTGSSPVLQQDNDLLSLFENELQNFVTAVQQEKHLTWAQSFKRYVIDPFGKKGLKEYNRILKRKNVRSDGGAALFERRKAIFQNIVSQGIPPRGTKDSGSTFEQLVQYLAGENAGLGREVAAWIRENWSAIYDDLY